MDPRRRQASASMSVKSEDVRSHARRASHSGTPLDDEEGGFLSWAGGCSSFWCKRANVGAQEGRTARCRAASSMVLVVAAIRSLCP